VIFFSFISPRSSCGNEAAALAAERTDDDDFTRVDEAIDDEADFTFPVRTPDEDRPIDYPPRVQKVDLVFAQVALALLLVPFECADVRERVFGCLFAHGTRSKRQ
jgi:hypothetical protein